MNQTKTWKSVITIIGFLLAFIGFMILFGLIGVIATGNVTMLGLIIQSLVGTFLFVIGAGLFILNNV